MNLYITFQYNKKKNQNNRLKKRDRNTIIMTRQFWWQKL